MLELNHKAMWRLDVGNVLLSRYLIMMHDLLPIFQESVLPFQVPSGLWSPPWIAAAAWHVCPVPDPELPAFCYHLAATALADTSRSLDRRLPLSV